MTIHPLRSGFLSLVASLFLVSVACAQLPQTRLYSLSRTGCRAGETIEVVITGGDDLEEVDRLQFSHPGITAVQKKTEAGDPVANQFVVTVAENVPVGLYEARCAGLFGMSNPRRFVIGQRTEVLETENNKPDPTEPQVVELNSTINGKMDGGTDVDWYKLTATQGQRIVLDCWAERIDSKLKATLTVYDASGRRPITSARYTPGTDPVLVFDVPANGEYVVKLHDQTFKNGNDYVYRLDVHTGPHIFHAVPPVAKAGTNAPITLWGVNLPGGQQTEQQLNGTKLESLAVSVQVPGETDSLNTIGRVRGVEAGIDAFDYRLDSPQGLSAPIRIGIGRSDVAVEQEPNNEAAAAQKVGVPAEVGGQFASIEDSDLYRFEAKAGEVLTIEVYAQRLGGLADPNLYVDQVVVDAEGKETLKRLATADDDKTYLLQNVFDTRSDDPKYQLTVPADGTYQLTVRDRYWETRGDPSLTYWLSVRKQAHDFRLVAMPAAPTAGQVWPTGLRRGDNFGVNVLAFREDGFEGPIEVRVEGLPEGVVCEGTTISLKENTGLLVFETTEDAKPGSYEVRIVGVAQVDDLEKVRAEAAAVAAVANAEKPLPDLRKALDQQQPKLAEAQQQLQQAEEALAKDAENEGLKKQRDQKKEAVDAAQKVVDEAQQKVAAQEKAIADAKAAQQAAAEARKNGAATITHAARTGTVVWPTANNEPAVSRVAGAFAFSIIPEVAPYQVDLERTKFEANQGRQLLIPVSIARRNEFKAKVQLNAAGMPKAANIDAPNIAIEEGVSDPQTWRLFVKDNAPPGIYSVWLTSQGQVAYSRNPGKAERLKAAHEAVKVRVEAAKTAAAEATKLKTDATNTTAQTQQLLTQAQQKQAEVQKEKQAADQLVAQTQKDKAEADKQLAAAQADAKARAAELAALEEQVKQATTAVEEKTAAQKQAQDALAADPENADLKKAVTDADAALTEATKQLTDVTAKRDAKKTEDTQAQEKSKVAEQAAQTAAAKLTEATKAQEQKGKDLEAATKLVADQTTALEAAKKAQTEAEQKEKAANDSVAAIEKERQAAEKAATDADNAAKPKNINFTPPTAPVVIEVKPAPIKLAATVPNGGAVKRGEQLEVTVKVTRQNGFEGPVNLTFPAPPGVQGMAAAAVVVPADAAEGKIILTAAGDATTGQLANTVIRAEMDFEGKAAVDAPITVNVNE
ncbi:MAG: hypothetical protein KDA88_16080 [Planctomycetaceae bacterium]|nr:hypothetical protein [Planctomycetaceae bacterium]MCB9953311.1 hypothetical protein [Planctomycetaceae bacterium]